jgi:arylsulfatase A-like enzyme
MKTLPITSLVALATTTGLTATPSAAPASSPRPNVLFIAVDDLRLNLGCFGDPVGITPNIDRLAARGTRFARAYAQQAVCNASRSSLLTGCYPDTTRVWDNYTFFRQTLPDTVTLPEYFKLNGYITNGIGKIFHNASDMNDWQAWTETDRSKPRPAVTHYRLAENRPPPNKKKKGAVTECADVPDTDYLDGKTARAAVAEIERLAARTEGAPPFFLAVGMSKPHAPYTAPKRYWDLYDPAKIPPPDPAAPPKNGPALALHGSPEIREYTDVPDRGPLPPELVSRIRHGYYAATSFSDAQIGLVLDALERTGLAQNTIVVLWGDHGYHLGEHGLWCKNTNYESDTRVPLIIATPDGRSRGVRSDALVELIDMYPTLVELCGLPPRPQLEGRSLAANIGEPGAPGLEGARSQFPRPYLRKRNAVPDYMGYAVRTATHRYVEWRKLGTLEVVARELYAYRGDELFETENIAGLPENAGLVNRLSAMLPQKIPLLPAASSGSGGKGKKNKRG